MKKYQISYPVDGKRQIVYNTSNAFDAVAELERLSEEYRDRKWILEIIEEGETS